MDVENLKNAIIFMKRVTATGEECMSWAQTYMALQRDLQLATAPRLPGSPPAAAKDSPTAKATPEELGVPPGEMIDP